MTTLSLVLRSLSNLALVVLATLVMADPVYAQEMTCEQLNALCTAAEDAVDADGDGCIGHDPDPNNADVGCEEFSACDLMDAVCSDASTETADEDLPLCESDDVRFEAVGLPQAGSLRFIAVTSRDCILEAGSVLMGPDGVQITRTMQVAVLYSGHPHQVPAICLNVDLHEPAGGADYSLLEGGLSAVYAMSEVEEWAAPPARAAMEQLGRLTPSDVVAQLEVRVPGFRAHVADNSDHVIGQFLIQRAYWALQQDRYDDLNTPVLQLLVDLELLDVDVLPTQKAPARLL